MKTDTESRSDWAVVTAILKATDDERRQIARELHDTATQTLAALSMSLGSLERAMDDPRRSRELAAECSSLVTKCVKELRAVSHLLHPPLLDELGLEVALRTYLEMYERRNGLSVKLVVVNPIGRLNPDLEMNAFRIIQESLSNVHLHSGSTEALVQIERRPRSLSLIIRDWGSIERPEAFADGFGIATMRERARLSGGRLSIEAADPGTMIRAVFPLE